MAQYTGAVKWFNNAKGYGFLGHEGGADVFVHFSSVIIDGYNTLKEGDPVEFDIIQGEKGRPQADKVVPLNRATPPNPPQGISPLSTSASPASVPLAPCE